MNLEQKVISLESAKRLDELCKEKGITLPESEYVWLIYENGYQPRLLFRVGAKLTIKGGTKGKIVSAHDVAELGEILHDEIGETRPCNAGWEVSTPVDRTDHRSSLKYSSEKNEAEARVKMLIWLIKHDKFQTK